MYEYEIYDMYNLYVFSKLKTREPVNVGDILYLSPIPISKSIDATQYKVVKKMFIYGDIELYIEKV